MSAARRAISRSTPEPRETAREALSETGDSYVTRGGLNHIAVVVDDLDAAEARVSDAGCEPRVHADCEPGPRFYFYDDGLEFEVVSYAGA